MLLDKLSKISATLHYEPVGHRINVRLAFTDQRISQRPARINSTELPTLLRPLVRQRQ
jgi:hypothetical protein